MQCRLCRQEATAAYVTPFGVAQLCADHGRVWEAGLTTLTPEARAERARRKERLDNWQVEWGDKPLTSESELEREHRRYMTALQVSFRFGPPDG
jgi:hypothetical protein